MGREASWGITTRDDLASIGRVIIRSLGREISALISGKFDVALAARHRASEQKRQRLQQQQKRQQQQGSSSTTSSSLVGLASVRSSNHPGWDDEDEESLPPNLSTPDLISYGLDLSHYIISDSQARKTIGLALVSIRSTHPLTGEYQIHTPSYW